LKFLQLASGARSVVHVSESVQVGTGRARSVGMAGLRNHRQFDAWQLAARVRTEVRKLLTLQGFHREIDLRDQLRRSARSPCPNIAEGFARYHPKDFARFVRIARGSLAETIEHLESAVEAGIITDSEAAMSIDFADRAIGACTRLICYLESAEAPNRPPKRRTPRSRSRFATGSDEDS
jgi:four helix bundle protein